MNNQEVSTAYVGSTEIKEARLGTQLVLAPGGDALWYKANEIPTLDLRFADNKSLVDATTGQNLVTFSRASGGTYVDSQGVIRTALANEPRFDHNPSTGESLGLLVEEPRTNRVLNSATNIRFSNGASPNTWVTGQTAPDGSTTAEICTTNNRGFIDYSASGTANNPITYSVYLKATSAITRTLDLKRNVSDISLATKTINITTDWQRFDITATSTSDGCRIEILGGIQNISAWGAQLEAGAFPTSYIPTTTATVPRAADIAQITGTNFSSWYNQSEGTVFAGAQLARQAAVAGTGILGIETGVTNAEAIYMHYRSSGLTAAQVFDNSVSQADFSPYNSAVPANQTIFQAIAFRVNDTNASGGGSIGTTDTTCSMPTPDRLLIGYNSAAGVYLSGRIRRLTFWPQRLSNATLQSITQ